MVVRIWKKDLEDLPWVERNLKYCLREGWARIIKTTESFVEVTATPKFYSGRVGIEVDMYLHSCLYDPDLIESEE